ncbi:hypothetical protein ElyMa_005258800 [Elysia marginata]|uniref:Uncharacterized protein n=1 Tax=Elysia marginata TaxID=1093978 RepID=A0AAV4JX08_9GAST|nr:hypothetical protein ElyMa_005258800 [Elysia marginata]
MPSQCLGVYNMTQLPCLQFCINACSRATLQAQSRYKRLLLVVVVVVAVAVVMMIAVMLDSASCVCFLHSEISSSRRGCKKLAAHHSAKGKTKRSEAMFSTIHVDIAAPAETRIQTQVIRIPGLAVYYKTTTPYR